MVGVARGLVVLFILHILVDIGRASNEGMCSAPTVLPPLCRDMPYNTTRLPNLFGQNLEAAGLEAHQFYPLVKAKCSDSFKLLVCTTYFPYCNPLLGIIPTCRHICDDTKRGCEGLMNKYGFSWPDSLSCDKYPEKVEGVICLDMQSTYFKTTTTTMTTTTATTSTPTTATTSTTTTATTSTTATTMKPTAKPPKRRRLMYRRLLTLLRDTARDVRDSMQSLYTALSP